MHCHAEKQNVKPDILPIKFYLNFSFSLSCFTAKFHRLFTGFLIPEMRENLQIIRSK